MSIGHCGFTGMGLPMNVPLPPVKNRPTPPAESRPLQRLAAVRRQQGVSRRTVARRLNIDIEQVQEQERETTDVPLSVLYAWQKVLEVPLAELLTEAGEGLDTPILERSQLLRLMKTVRAICEQARQESIRRMARNDGRPTHRDHARTGQCRRLAHRWKTAAAERVGNRSPAALRGRGLYRQRRTDPRGA